MSWKFRRYPTVMRVLASVFADVQCQMVRHQVEVETLLEAFEVLSLHYLKPSVPIRWLRIMRFRRDPGRQAWTHPFFGPITDHELLTRWRV